MANDINMETARASSSYYDELWKSYGIGPTDECERLRLRFIQCALKGLHRNGDLKILDLGCGRGWMAPFLADFGHVTGVDFSSQGIEYARQHYGQYAEFILATNDYGMRGQRFDIVVCSEVIEHVVDHLKFLRNVQELMSAGGYLLLTTPNGNLWHAYSKMYGAQEIENWLTPPQLRSLVLASGFRIITHEGRTYSRVKPGLAGLIQNRYVETVFSLLALSKAHGRLIRSTALYQVIQAQKVSD